MNSGSVMPKIEFSTRFASTAKKTVAKIAYFIPTNCFDIKYRTGILSVEITMEIILTNVIYSK